MPGATEPIRSEVRIAAPPEIVFAYFTDPTRIVDWMGIAAVLDPRPGGTFRVEANGRDVVLGEYLEVDPPRRLQLGLRRARRARGRRLHARRDHARARR